MVGRIQGRLEERFYALMPNEKIIGQLRTDDTNEIHILHFI